MVSAIEGLGTMALPMSERTVQRVAMTKKPTIRL